LITLSNLLSDFNSIFCIYLYMYINLLVNIQKAILMLCVYIFIILLGHPPVSYGTDNVVKQGCLKCITKLYTI
jgi:hypothetical protein